MAGWVAPLDRKLLRDLRRLGGQGLAAAVIIATASALFVMAFSLEHSLQLTLEKYYERGRFADLFLQAKRVPNNVAPELARLPGVNAVQTRVTGPARTRLPGPQGARRASLKLLSLPPGGGQPKLNRLHLVSGRLPAAGRTTEVVLNAAFAHANNLRRGDTLAITANGTRRALKVVGRVRSPEFIYAVEPGAILADKAGYGIAWGSHDLVAELFDRREAFTSVTVRTDPAARQEAFAERLERALADYGVGAATLRGQQSSHVYVKGEIDQLRATGAVLPGVFLAVAAFLLYVLLSRVVELERSQIGLLKAFGYTGWAIARHYIKLVASVALVGSVLGIAGGYALGRGVAGFYQDFFGFPFLLFRVPPATALQAVGVGLAAAVAGVAGAVRRAAQLPPAEAMQAPPPPSFGRGLLDRLGLKRVLGIVGRLVLRLLGRRPLRTAGNVVGIACAVGLLVSAGFFLDAIDKLLAFHDDRAERQNVTVSFSEPQPPGVLAELRRLAGVLRVEGELSLPAQLAAHGQHQSAAVTGLAGPSGMHRHLAASGRAIPVTPGGLVLGGQLAHKLGVQAGDTVHVAFREGRHRQASLPVARVVRRYFGSGVYLPARRCCAWATLTAWRGWSSWFPARR